MKQTQEDKVISEVLFQNIKLQDITPDPNQPRKFYEEQAMQELTESVRENGVLQPILVRPKHKGKGYMLVCGERRYRAALSVNTLDKERSTIPAVIRELNDEEALQLQIVENLQRQDVHPMEEAVAFKSFIEGKKWSFEEIGKRVGKSEYYVRQRIKLNNLIEPFQQLFFKHQMEIGTALDIARTDKVTQEQILADLDEEALADPEFHLKINSWEWDKYNANLDSAPFDIRDAELNKAMGPCTHCQFNSSVSKLFPDEKGNTACGNIACFVEKANTSFELHLQLAQEDPAVVLITTEYQLSNETKQLMKSIDGILGRELFEIAQIPGLPERESYTGNNNTEAEDEVQFQKAMKQYQDNTDKLKKKVESGSYLKAFVVGGNDKGKYTYVKLNKVVSDKQKAQSGNTSPTADEIAIEEIDTEIQRLKDKEKRAKEIDGNKIWDEIKVMLTPGKYALELGGPLTDLEITAVARAMYNALDWHHKDEFRKIFKFDGLSKKFPKVSTQIFDKMCRYFFLSLLPPANCTKGISNSFEATMCVAIAEKYFPQELLEIRNEADVKTEKRVKRFNERIKELQDKKKKMKSALPKAKK